MSSSSSSHPFLSDSSKSANLAAGTILQDRYRIVRRMGKGGMGAVYEAIDARLDATVAIKEAFSRDPRLRRQFEHEARLLAQLHHPALPRVTDYFGEGDRVFLVMQFIGGDDLAHIISRHPGPLPRNTVIAWADQLLDALIYLHSRERQIIHRDIKPHNLKLTSAGSIALLDFGLAKADSDTTTMNSTSVFGFTRRYSPPEQMQDQGTTPQSDIYALGATLYHLLTGVKPPDALVRTAAIAKAEKDPLAPANDIHFAVGPEVSAILLKAMELNPDRRFQNATEFRSVLRRLGRHPDQAGRTHDWSQTGTTDGAARPNVNVTLINKTTTIDPFDSYSILRPTEHDWLLPKPSRRPLFAFILIGLLLAGGAFAFSDNVGWNDLSEAPIDYVQTKTDRQPANPVKPERNVESVRPATQLSSAKSETASVRGEQTRKNQNVNRAVKRTAAARKR